jgi:hypothetical protein
LSFYLVNVSFQLTFEKRKAEENLINELIKQENTTEIKTSSKTLKKY